MKDNFSSNSSNYARFRPNYPVELFDFIYSKLDRFDSAWDCGTGNGQVAKELSRKFKTVEATDISANQLQQAHNENNIRYSLMPAESTSFKDSSFDLVTCAQAIHWFDFDRFYQEVYRCLEPGGYLAVLGYSLLKSNKETNDVIEYFYKDIIGEYWDEERKYLEDDYKTIPFPFKEINTPQFEQKYTWHIEHLLGYLRTWSSVKHFIEDKEHDPVLYVEDDLRKVFGKKNSVNFPILFKMGKLVP